MAEAGDEAVGGHSRGQGRGQTRGRGRGQTRGCGRGLINLTQEDIDRVAQLQIQRTTLERVFKTVAIVIKMIMNNGFQLTATFFYFFSGQNSTVEFGTVSWVIGAVPE